MNFRKSLLKILLFACLTVPVSVFPQSDTLELPFFEDWSSGSLDTNGWVADSNWTVNADIGNPEPTVQFDATGIELYYERELYSNVIHIGQFTVGKIWLSFDLKLESSDAYPWNGTLSVELRNDKGWYLLKQFDNKQGEFDWKSEKIDVSDYIVGNDIQLRFVAKGDNDIITAWYLDNIDIHHTCVAPFDFGLAIDTVTGYDLYQLNFNWQIEEPEEGDWMGYDDGLNYSGVGTCPDCWFWAAARWDAGDLSAYDNYQISKIKAFLYDDKYDSLTFFIWEGNSIDDQVYSSLHDTVIGHEWIVDPVDTLLFLHAENEYWVGYKVWIDQTQNFPLGVDVGPAVVGYGNKISYDEGTFWDNLSDYGIDGNWNIRFYVSDTSGSETRIGGKLAETDSAGARLLGYNLYQSEGGGEYELLQFIPWVRGDTSHRILFTASPYLRCFKLTAMWASETDTCESAPAISKDNPEEDFVCVLLVGNEENNIGQSDLIRCFPNPFSNSTTIEYTLHRASTVQISIFNSMGEQVGVIQKEQSAGKQQVVWDAKGLPSGMYYFTVQAGKKSMHGKMMIVR
ncbi:MAG: T9SS type A sorting domain-containing protein [Bacteroidales bacterium]|nr:T9SS type A sorting domain-containing protein [Bacteroidales bacterium]